MSEPISRGRKLHRNEQVTAVREPPMPRSICHHIREDGWVANFGQEVCQDDPLITTAYFRANGIEVTAVLVDKAVMGFEESEVQLRDDKVFIVAWVSDQGRAVRR